MLRDDDDDSLPRGLLDAWQVPDAPPGLEDAIMNDVDSVNAELPAVARPRNAMSLVVPLLAGLSAAALVLVWTGVTNKDETPPLVAVNQPSAAPVAGAVVPAPSATVVLQVNPDQATVELDGVALVGPGPFVATGLQPGVHQLRVVADGFLSIERKLELAAGTTKIPLRLATRHVSLHVDVTPRDADLVLREALANGNVQLTRRNITEIDRNPESTYAIEASAEGHLTRQQSIAFDGSGSQSVTIVLPRDPEAPQRPKPKPAKTATLRIGTNVGAAPAEVSVDGKYVGLSPQGELKVVPGKHEITWRWSDGRTVRKQVTVGAGQIQVARAG